MDFNDLAVADALGDFASEALRHRPRPKGHCSLRAYGAIPCGIWRSLHVREFPRLSSHGKLLFLYFLSSPVSTMIGLYYDSLRDIAHYTGLTHEDLEAAIQELQTYGLIAYSRETEYVLVRDFMETQTIASGPIKSPTDKRYIAVLRVVGAVEDEQLRAAWTKRHGAIFGLNTASSRCES